MWESIFIFKIRIILWFSVQNRLSIVDRLISRGWCIVKRCLLCYYDCESMDYLFFNYFIFNRIWSDVLSWIGFNRKFMILFDELKWYERKVRGKKVR